MRLWIEQKSVHRSRDSCLTCHLVHFTQVVAGINHYLTIETHDDAGKHTVEVQVWEKLPSNVKANELPVELTNFKIVEGHQQVKITGDVQL